jgi:cell division septal protein FtsQ
MISSYSTGTNWNSKSKKWNKFTKKKNYKHGKNRFKILAEKILLLYKRWFRVLGVTAIILGCIGTLVFGVYEYYKTNDVLLLKEIQYNGNYHISNQKIAQNLGVLVNSKLWSLQIDTLEKKLESMPWVSKANISRKLPDKLVISIVEQKPISLFVEKENGISQWKGVLNSGELLSNIQLDKYNLPILDISKDRLSDVSLFIDFIFKNHQELYKSISQLVEIPHSKKSEYAIYLRQYNCRLLVDIQEDWNVVLSLWESLQKQNSLEIQNANQVDLRVPGYSFIS